MSIKEMISEHPQVGGDYNEKLSEAVKHAMYGAAIMNSCADACLAEGGDRAQCIRTCLDASDACTAFYRMGTRRTGENVPAIKAIGAAAIIACEQCLIECEKHTDAYCTRCARMCREVIDDVKKAVQCLGKED